MENKNKRYAKRSLLFGGLVYALNVGFILTMPSGFYALLVFLVLISACISVYSGIQGLESNKKSIAIIGLVLSGGYLSFFAYGMYLIYSSL